MGGLARFSVSVEADLLDAFDAFVREEGHATRSEALKRLMRGALIEKEWDDGAIVAGALVMVYDHHRRDLVTRLMDTQHDFGGIVLSTQHVHLDHDNCLEVVTLKGAAGEIRRFASSVKALKGIKHCSLVATTTGDIA